MAETVLVTGGSGFIGGWCIVELLRRGYVVRTTVRSLAKEQAVRDALRPHAPSGQKLSFVAADLTKDDGWAAAMAGCGYVLHVASPLGIGGADEAQALIDTAREGTLRVLRAAVAARVKRVVSTSSCAACRGSGKDDVSDETVWTDPDGPDLNGYRLSKVFAEKAAWDFVKEGGGATELVTVLPSAVFGPVLTRDNLGSVQIVQRLLDGRLPATPQVGMCVVDVRDVAEMHVRAMESPAAAGERFIAAGDFLWMKDIANLLRERLGERAAKVPTRAMPNFMTRILAFFAPPLRNLLPMLGRRNAYSSAKARRVLGMELRPAAATIEDCANSLLS